MNANFICKIAKIYVGNNVMFGPNVTLIIGGHRVDELGEYMINVHEKLPEIDKDIIVEEDVWVGANVTILKGVTIGRGSVAGAESIVTKNIPPYSIYVGVPAKVIKYRFTNEEMIEHEKLLKEVKI